MSPEKLADQVVLLTIAGHWVAVGVRLGKRQLGSGQSHHRRGKDFGEHGVLEIYIGPRSDQEVYAVTGSTVVKSKRCVYEVGDIER